jgi:hypothetical protein
MGASRKQGFLVGFLSTRPFTGKPLSRVLPASFGTSFSLSPPLTNISSTRKRKHPYDTGIPASRYEVITRALKSLALPHLIATCFTQFRSLTRKQRKADDDDGYHQKSQFHRWNAIVRHS